MHLIINDLTEPQISKTEAIENVLYYLTLGGFSLKIDPTQINTGFSRSGNGNYTYFDGKTVKIARGIYDTKQSDLLIQEPTSLTGQRVDPEKQVPKQYLNDYLPDYGMAESFTIPQANNGKLLLDMAPDGAPALPTDIVVVKAYRPSDISPSQMSRITNILARASRAGSHVSYVSATTHDAFLNQLKQVNSGSLVILLAPFEDNGSDRDAVYQLSQGVVTVDEAMAITDSRGIKLDSLSSCCHLLGGTPFALSLTNFFARNMGISGTLTADGETNLMAELIVAVNPPLTLNDKTRGE